jgi:hypothetical protein
MATIRPQRAATTVTTRQMALKGWSQVPKESLINEFMAFDLVPLNPAFQTITVNKTNSDCIIGVVVERRLTFRH